MANTKLTYTNLLKTLKTTINNKQETIEVPVGDLTIAVKQYLPINEKMDLIAKVLTESRDENQFFNPVKLDVIGQVNIIMAYTNITFTDKQRFDIEKIYDAMVQSGVLDTIINAIPQDEYNFIIDSINELAQSIYTYNCSALGILTSMSRDFDGMDSQLEKIQKALQDPESLRLLKNVLDKMG